MLLVAGPDVVRIAPSLVISLDEILEGLARLETALNRALTRPVRRCSTSARSRATTCPSILALSERTGTGLTTLPANRERLAARIERSLASFAGDAERADACYMFVLVDSAATASARADRVVGISAIEAAVGLTRALVQLSRRHARARVAPARRVHRRRPRCSSPTTTRATPSSARCSSTRRTGTARTACCSPSAGCSSSPSSPSRFAAKVIAELRGRLDADGPHPVLGRPRAPLLRDGVLDRRLPDRHRPEVVHRRADAQASGLREPAAAGRARRDRRRARATPQPARAMLEQEGFRYEGYVDIFDAGPTRRMLSRQHPRGAPVAGACRSRSARKTPSPTASPTTSCGSCATASFADFRAIVVAAPGARRPLAAACRTRPKRCSVARRRHRARGAAVAGGRDRWQSNSTSTASRARRTTTRASRTAISRPSATRARSRIRAKRRCRASRRCARSPQRGIAAGRAAAARASGDGRAARARLRRQRRGRARARRARRARRCSPRARRRRRCGSPTPPRSARRADTADRRVHFTPANLATHFHRALEAPTTTPCCARSSPTRRASSCTMRCRPRRKPATRARRTTRASRGGRRRRRVLRLRPPRATGRDRCPRDFPRARRSKRRRPSRAGTDSTPARTVFAQQNPQAIDAGVFHNDVIAVGHGATHVLPRARVARRQRGARRPRARASAARSTPIVVRDVDVTLDDAVVDLPLQQPARRRGPKAACCSSHRPSAARIRASPRISIACSRAAARIARSDHVRPAPEHAQRRRPRVPAPARRADGRRARGDRCERVPRRRARATRSRRGFGTTIATVSRPPISPIPRCSTSRVARSTSSRSCCASAASTRSSADFLHDLDGNNARVARARATFAIASRRSRRASA